jgi:tRNA(fMet)-specific endonuclease VapC
MPVVLDSDHLTLLQRQSPESVHVLARLDQLAPDDIATTIVSFQEQFQGWLAYLNKAKKPEQIVRARSKNRQHRFGDGLFVAEPQPW